MSSPAGNVPVQEATTLSTRTTKEPTVTNSDSHIQTRRAAEALGNTIDSIVCPPVIPPKHTTGNRTLVLCFDGTGDQFDADNSNVVQFVQLLKKDDRTKQLVYYQVREVITMSHHEVSADYHCLLVWHWHLYNTPSRLPVHVADQKGE